MLPPSLLEPPGGWWGWGKREKGERRKRLKVVRDRLQEGEGGGEEAEMILELLAKNGGIEKRRHRNDNLPVSAKRSLA